MIDFRLLINEHQRGSKRANVLIFYITLILHDHRPYRIKVWGYLLWRHQEKPLKKNGSAVNFDSKVFQASKISSLNHALIENIHGQLD